MRATVLVQACEDRSDLAVTVVGARHPANGARSNMSFLMPLEEAEALLRNLRNEVEIARRREDQKPRIIFDDRHYDFAEAAQ